MANLRSLGEQQSRRKTLRCLLLEGLGLRTSGGYARRPLNRTSSVESLEKRQLMASDLDAITRSNLVQLPAPLFDDYVGIGQPVLVSDKPSTPSDFIGPKGRIWIDSASDTVEGGDATFVVKRSSIFGSMDVHYRIDTSSTAFPGKDFQSWGGVVTFAPDQSQAAISITTIDDRIPESTEQLTIRLTSSSAGNAAFGSVDLDTTNVSAQILDNDSLPSIPVITISSSYVDQDGLLSLQRISTDTSNSLTIHLEVKTLGATFALGSTQVGTETRPLEVTFKPNEQSISLPVRALAFTDGDHGLLNVKLQSDPNRYSMDANDSAEVHLFRPLTAKQEVASAVATLETDASGQQRVLFSLATPTATDLTILIDEDLDGVVDATRTIAAGTSSTSFLPSVTNSDDPTLINILYSSSSVVAQGTITRGKWIPFTDRLNAAAVNGPRKIRSLGLLADTGLENDLSTFNPTVFGRLSGQANGASTKVQFDHFGDGTVDGQLVLAEAQTSFVYDPRLNDDDLKGFSGTFPLKYRLVDDSTNSSGEWEQFSFTVQPMPNTKVYLAEVKQGDLGKDESVSVAGHLAVANYYTNGERPIATSSTAQGGYVSDFAGSFAAANSERPDKLTSTTENSWTAINTGLVSVELDLDGDGSSDLRKVVAPDLSFSVDNLELPEGKQVVGLRVAEWNLIAGGLVHGIWSQLDVKVPAKLPKLSNIELREGADDEHQVTAITGTLSTQSTSVDATIFEQIRIGFDSNTDGVSEGFVYVDSNGNFSIDISNLPSGNVPLRLRVEKAGSKLAGDSIGAWEDHPFLLPTHLLSSVASLVVVNASGSGPLVANTVDLIGVVKGSQIEGQRVELDVNGDGIADAATISQLDGQFSYTARNLSAGNNTIAARVVGWDDNQDRVTNSSWFSVSFTIALPPESSQSTFSSSGEPGDSNGRITLPVSVVGSRTPQYAQVELDFNSNGTSDQTVSVDSLGEFSFLKSSVPASASSIKARGVGYDADWNTVYGPWVTIDMTMFSGSFPAVITRLELLSDSGSSFDDNRTENPTIVGVGYLKDAAAGSSLIVQIDENGDGVIDASTTTQADGGFVYKPRFLPFGNASVRVRAVEWQQATGAYRTGIWSSIGFTYEDQVDQAAVIRNAVISTPTAVGSSATEFTTRLQGRITNESLLSGIVIEIDADNDDVKDQITTTDALGRFSAQLFGTSTGLADVRVRTRELDAVSRQYQYGPWTAVTTGDSDGSGGDPTDGDPSGGGSSGSGGNEETDSTHQAAIDAANDAHAEASSNAKKQYDDQLATADEAYRLALEAAGASFGVAIAGFNGNTTSFDYRKFEWPQAPSSGTFTFPDDSSLPAPPLEKPTYTGPAYDFVADDGYQTLIAANHNAFEVESQAAETDFKNAKKAAEDRHKARVDQINADYDDVVEAAQDQYETDSDIDTTELDDIDDAFQAAIQAAWDAYQTTAQTLGQDLNDAMRAAWDSLQASLQASYASYSSAVQSAWSAYASATSDPYCGCEVHRTASIDYSRAVYEAQKTLDKDVSTARNGYDHAISALIKQYSYDMADAWEAYQQAAIDAQHTADKAKNDFNERASQAREDARFDLENRLVNAATNRDKRIADSERQLAIDIALAQKALTIRIETARVTMWRADASAKLAAIQAWHTQEGTTWTAYQLELAQHEANYYDQLANAHMTFTNVTAKAEYDRQVARADAQKTYRYEMIDAGASQRRNSNSATHTANNSSIARTRDSADDDADERKTLRDGQNDKSKTLANADAAEAYANAVSDAWHAYTTAMVDARQFIVTSNTCANSNQDRRYWGWTAVVVSHSASANIYNTLVKALNQAQYDYALANINNNGGATSALAGLWDTYQDAKDARDTADSNAQATDNRTRSDSASQGEHDYAIAVMAIQGRRSNAFAQADLNYTITVTPAKEIYDNLQVSLVGTNDNLDALSSKNFKVNTATQYSTVMGNWNSSFPNPWTAYHKNLGTIELAWANNAGPAEVTYVNRLTVANNVQSVSVTAANSIRTVANANVERAFVAAIVTARNAFAVAAAAAKLGRAQDQSEDTETSIHNSNNDDLSRDDATRDREAAQTQALQDAEKAYQIALLDAWLALANASADAQRDYSIASGQAWEDYFNDEDWSAYMAALQTAGEDYSDAMETAYDAYNTAVKAAWDALRAAYTDALREDTKADAEDQRNKVHNQQDERERSSNSQTISIVAQAGLLRQAEIDLALATASANKTRAAAVAENERTYIIAAANASKLKTDVSVDATAIRAEADFIAEAARREDRVAARGIYEVAVYNNIAATMSSQAATLGTALANYQALVAQAEAVRANSLRIAKDAYEDAISYASLAELQANNNADRAKNTTIGAAELTYATAMAAADKVQTIAQSNAYYDLYFMNAAAEAVLREALMVTQANFANTTVVADVARQKTLADAAKALSDAVADARHALESALNADWEPYNWYGGGWGGWYGGWGWGGWYGGYGGWGYGWGGWYGGAGYVFGYSGWGWGYGYGYGYYGGFGGWYGGGWLGWGWGGWYGGWYGGWGYGLGGFVNGDHTSDYDTFNQAQEDAQDDYDDAADGANDDYEDAAAAAGLTRATRNGNAAVAFATARGIAGVQYVTAINAASLAYDTTTTTANAIVKSDSSMAEKLHSYSVAQSSAVRKIATVEADVTLRVAEKPIYISYTSSVVTGEANYHIAEAGILASKLQSLAVTSPLGAYEAAYADARVNWLQSVAPTFISKQSGKEQNERQLSIDMANLEKALTIAHVNADRTYSLREADAQQALTNLTNPAQATFDSRLVTETIARRALRGADSQTYEIAMAQAAKGYEVAVAQAAIDHDPGDAYDSAIKAAKLSRAIAESDAARAWSHTEHLARQAFTENIAMADRDYQITLANGNRAFKDLLSQQLRIRMDVYANAEFTIAQAEETVKNSKIYQDAILDTSYWTSEASALVGANSIIRNRLNTPWSQFLVNSASANAGWWSTVTPTYFALISDRAAAQTSYKISVANDKRNLDLTTSSNTETYSLGNAALIRDAKLLDIASEYNYVDLIADQAFTFTERLAQIERDKGVEQAQNNWGAPGSGGSTNWESEKTLARNAYTTFETAKQSIFRQSVAQRNYNLELTLIAQDVALATAKSTSGTAYRNAESNLQRSKQVALTIIDSTYATFEHATVAGALSSAALSLPSPWMSYASAEASALAAWFVISAPAKASLDAARATAQRDQELGYYAAQNAWQIAELAGFRPDDRLKALERFNEASQLVPRELPLASISPSLGFYRQIAAGTVPASFAASFSTSGSSNSSGYGGGSGGGTNVLDPDGNVHSGGSGGGYGSDGYGGSGSNYGGGISGMGWDLIAHADAIQRMDSADALIELYWLRDGDLKSILDFEIRETDEPPLGAYGDGSGANGSNGNDGSSGYGYGAGAYGGLGSGSYGDGVGVGSMPSGEGGRTPQEQDGKNKQFDVQLFKQYLGRLDPVALMVFEEGGGKLEFRKAWLWGETSVTSRGGIANGDLTIWIDRNLDELDAAIRVINYMENSWSNVRQKYFDVYAKYEESHGKASDPGLGRGADAQKRLEKDWYKKASEATSTGVALYLGFLSMVNEGVDLIVTVEELSKGNWMASIGLLPFVPAGGFVRVVDKAGNSKLIDNAMMHKIKALGNNVDTNAVRKMLDTVPDDVWCFAAGTLVSTPTGKRTIETIQPGERVCAYDYKQSAWVASEVTKLHCNRYSGLWCTIQTSGGSLEVTAAHPIWVESGKDLDSRDASQHFEAQSGSEYQLEGRWVNSHQVLPGDKLVSHDGKHVVVISVKLSEVQDVEVFNLTVYNTHTFAVGDDAILTHNKSWCEVMAAKGMGNKPKSLEKLVGVAKTDGGKLVTGSLIHGHHIVMKTVPSKLWDLRRPYIQKAQDILKDYDVNLLGTMDELEKAAPSEIHNLCYAINGYKGIHSLAYTKAVAKKLEQAVLDATRKGGKVDYDLARENIIEALGKMKATLERGNKFW